MVLSGPRVVEEAALSSGRAAPCSAMESESRTEESGRVAAGRKGQEALGPVREPNQTDQRNIGICINLLQRQGFKRKRMQR